MKIAIDGRCLAASVTPGQAARYTQGVIAQLAQIGFEPDVAYCASDPVPHDLLASARATPLGGAGWFWEQVSLARFLRAGRFDLLHIPTQHARPPHWSPCPVVMTFHCGHDSPAVAGGSDTAAPDHMRRRRVQHIIFVRPFCLPFVSPQSANATVVSPIEADHCSASSHKCTALPVAPIRQPYLLTRDSGDGTTDIKLLTAAFRQVRVHFPQLQLVVVCRSLPSVHILEYVGQCGLLLDDDVVFVPDSAGLLLELSNHAELGFAPEDEGQCHWVVPAMARGLEFACSPTGCAARVVGAAGRIAARSDPAEFARAITYLLETGDRLQRAAPARRQAQRFEGAGAANGTLAVYAALLGQRVRPPIGQDPVPDRAR